MRKAYVGLCVSLMICLLFLAACNSGSKMQTEEDICRAVFETIQNGDAETFKSYCTTVDQMAAMLANMDESSPKEKSIKEDLATEDVAAMNAESVKFFQRTQSEATANKLDLKTAVYEGVVDSEVRVKTSAFTAIRTEFKVSFDAHLYYVRLDVFQTPETITVYNTKLLDFKKVDMSLAEPKDNPLVITEGDEIAVQVAFDAATANEYGAWIQVLFDGKNAGMMAGTTLESPYTNDIPRKPLSVGTHTAIYRMHPGGQRTYRPLGEVVLEIEVK